MEQENGKQETGIHLFFKIFVGLVTFVYILGFMAVLTETQISSVILLLSASLTSTFIIINNHSWRIRKLYWLALAMISISPFLVHFIGVYSGTEKLWFGYMPISFLVVTGILQQVFLRITGRYPVYEKPVETKEDGLYALLLIGGGLLLAHEWYGWVYQVL